MGKQPAKPPRPPKPQPLAAETGAPARERIAKRLARAGLCSRREAETWIVAGRISVNGKLLDTPAFTVGPEDRIEVDGAPLPQAERTRLWLFHKPAGLVTTARDPEGRPTVFSALPKDMPRVMSIGRLDINTEGLLLLTNDGGLARLLELPQTGWLRRYRVRAHGEISQEQLDALKDGIAVEGVLYGSMEATLDRQQGANVWITLALREGKNREVKKVLGALGLTVNRLIRISFGPFQLGDLAEREVREIRGRMLRDQLGPRLIEAAGANFDAPLIQRAEEPKAESKRDRMARPGQPQGQKPRKLSRGQAAEDSLDRLDTRKSARGPGQKPKATKPGQPKTFGKPDGKRMRNDGRAADGAGGEKRPHTPGGGRPQRPAGGGPAGRGRGNADRRR
jgi:23S rRNA pseudouridine2605 synthase